MRQNDSRLNFEADRLNVFVVPQVSKFKEEWLFLFRRYLSATAKALSPGQKAVLFDLIALGSVSPEGLVFAPTSVLVCHGPSRATVYRALEVLQYLGLIVGPEDGMVYLNPRLLYRGFAGDWSAAIQHWKKLGGKDED